jgi:pimeloyl-ACP methyl ester carboxylesterase
VGATTPIRDIDRLRVALGESVISYVGYSYGTLLGATYADRFPKSVRAMVFDGGVDPTLTAVEAYIDQAQAGERALHAFC